MSRKKASVNYYSWVIAYIESTYISRVDDDLNRYPEYDEVQAYIPTVRILKKTFKGKQNFEEVPLLFNYGFFKIPRKYAIHPRFLEDLKANVPCIYAWVKDPQKMVRRKPEGSVLTDKDVYVATATSEEIAILVKNQTNFSIYDAGELGKFEAGTMITLKGYPWEGMEGTIISLDMSKREVTVEVEIFKAKKQVKMAFDNVFFTVYHNKGYDDSITIKNSLDEMQQNNSLDKVTFKNSKHDEG